MNQQTTDISNPGQLTLTVRLDTKALAFAISGGERACTPRISLYKTDPRLPLAANLREAFRQTDWLRLPFGRTAVMTTDGRTTFMPLGLFEEEQAENVFCFNLGRRDNETVLYNILPNQGIVTLFGIDRSAYRCLLEQWPEAQFYAQATPCIERFLTDSRTTVNRRLYAMMRTGSIGCYATHHGRLLLANSLPAQTVTDCLYFLLYLWKQLDFDRENDELLLAGELPEEEVLLTQLRRFVRRVTKMEHAPELDLRLTAEYIEKTSKKEDSPQNTAP